MKIRLLREWNESRKGAVLIVSGGIGNLLVQRGVAEEIVEKVIESPPRNKAIDAPYGFKKDGTPKRKPGRPKTKMVAGV